MINGTPAGHVAVPADELAGEALAWAACALWQVPAAILEGRVHIITDGGTAMPFDPAVMLRSLIVGHGVKVYVPNELIGEREAH